jgi:hypothetical protein
MTTATAIAHSLSEVRRAAAEQALARGLSIAQAAYTEGFAAACQEQWLRGGGTDPAGRQGFLSAEMLENPLFSAAGREIGETGRRFMEAWICGEWPAICERAIRLRTAVRFVRVDR